MAELAETLLNSSKGYSRLGNKASFDSLMGSVPELHFGHIHLVLPCSLNQDQMMDIASVIGQRMEKAGLPVEISISESNSVAYGTTRIDGSRNSIISHDITVSSNTYNVRPSYKDRPFIDIHVLGETEELAKKALDTVISLIPKPAITHYGRDTSEETAEKNLVREINQMPDSCTTNISSIPTTPYVAENLQKLQRS